MNDFILPPCRVDLADWPPLIDTRPPNAFAHNTFKTRIPIILDETISLNDFSPEIQISLQNLRAEITDGRIRGLTEGTADRSMWDVLAGPYLGRSWLDVPWYWAEAFFYRRVLEATTYFQPGPWQGVDPYAPKKATEWQPQAAPDLVNRQLALLPDRRADRLRLLLYASLWGNRTDLSYNVAEQLGRTGELEADQADLLVDHAPLVGKFLREREDCRLVIIADNAGTEVLMDLALADFLLNAGLAARIELHLKPQPFYVSDAMLADVTIGISALAGGGRAAAALGRRLQAHRAAGRLTLKTHWFYISSLCYYQLPPDLLADLQAADLVLVKGDANYRRLLGDAQWPPETPFEQITAYFPAALVALRTLKAELIAGLAPGRAAELAAEDPAWLVNGQRGLIQARLGG